MGGWKKVAFLSGIVALGITSQALAERDVPLERASGETLATAVGHFARSRSLLIAAIHEFDEGLRFADPNSLLDAPKWRSTLITRAEELERVLDPQPRATKGGVKYNADSRLLGEKGKKDK